MMKKILLMQICAANARSQQTQSSNCNSTSRIFDAKKEHVIELHKKFSLAKTENRASQHSKWEPCLNGKLCEFYCFSVKKSMINRFNFKEGDMFLYMRQSKEVNDDTVMCNNETPNETPIIDKSKGKLHFEIPLKHDFKLGVRTTGSRKHDLVPCLDGYKCALACIWFKQKFTLVYLGKKQVKKNICLKKQKGQKLVPRTGLMATDLCEDGYEIMHAGRTQRSDDYKVHCDPEDGYSVEFLDRNKRGQWIVVGRQRRKSSLCQKITACSMDELQFHDHWLNDEDMFQIQSKDRNKQFQSGKPLSVQCKHSSAKTELHCLRGKVVPNYDCPKVDQTSCPTFRKEDGFDLSFGCTRIWNDSLIDMKCKYKNKYGAYDTKMRQKKYGTWMKTGSACPKEPKGQQTMKLRV